MRKILSAALGLMGFTNDEDENEEFEMETKSRRTSEKIVALRVESSQTTVMLVNPKGFDEVAGIADSLNKKKIVTINPTNVDTAHIRRILDFANGVVYALDGSVMKLGDNIYLFAGRGVVMEEKETQEISYRWR